MWCLKQEHTLSAKSDKYEKDVADYVNNSGQGITASRPKVPTSYSDVLVEYVAPKSKTKVKPIKVWIEVKMNHTDNLMNPRFSFIGNRWVTDEAYKSPSTNIIEEYWNKNKEARKWIEDLRIWLGTQKSYKGDPSKFTLYSTKTPRKKDPNSVSPELMKKFLMTKPNKNICAIQNVDVGKLVTLHYLKGKSEPAHYLSAGNDFYRFGRGNPLKIPNIPEFKGMNRLVFRVGDRSDNYELQAEVKLSSMGASSYSIKPGTGKRNPFKFIGIK